MMVVVVGLVTGGGVFPTYFIWLNPNHACVFRLVCVGDADLLSIDVLP